MRFISSIPFKNILARPGRSASLVAFAALLSLATFGGSFVVASLSTGLKSLERRLGADIIVVPYEARTKGSVDEILLNGNRSKTYMPRSYLEKISGIEGVETVSPQIYISSLTASCCAISVEVVGFDPGSDFTVQPWIRESHGGELKDGEILIGSMVDFPADRKLRLFGTDFSVASQLHRTGSALDRSVYASENTVREMISSCTSASPTSKIDVDSKISSIMVKVADGYSVEDVKNEINVHNKKVRAVNARTYTTSVSSGLSSVSGAIGALVAFVWILCVAIISIVFSMMINERRREFAVLRVSGFPKRRISSLIVRESLILNVSGGLMGIFLALLAVVPFSTLIGQSLEMPYLMPHAWKILLLALFSCIVSALTAAISASFTARKISNQDASLVLREG